MTKSLSELKKAVKKLVPLLVQREKTNIVVISTDLFEKDGYSFDDLVVVIDQLQKERFLKDASTDSDLSLRQLQVLYP